MNIDHCSVHNSPKIHQGKQGKPFTKANYSRPSREVNKGEDETDEKRAIFYFSLSFSLREAISWMCTLDYAFDCPRRPTDNGSRHTIMMHVLFFPLPGELGEQHKRHLHVCPNRQQKTSTGTSGHLSPGGWTLPQTKNDHGNKRSIRNPLN